MLHLLKEKYAYIVPVTEQQSCISSNASNCVCASFAGVPAHFSIHASFVGTLTAKAGPRTRSSAYLTLGEYVD
jgi:hypothetical protein